jgi:hypothetical protein
LEVAPQECTCVAKRATPLLQAGIPQGPGLNQVRPDFERYEHVSRPRRGRETDGIVEQRFGRSDLDQRRWETPEKGFPRAN